MTRYDVNDVFWKYTNLGDIEKRIGKKVFAGDNYDSLLERANRGAEADRILEGTGVALTGRKGLRVTDLNGNSEIVTYIIVEKEPERKPLDLSKIEIRDCLRDKWIRRKRDSYEKKITYFSKNSTGWKCCNLNAIDLFKEWEFIEPVNGSKIIGEFK